MKNLYWLSIAFGLVVAGFFLADRRFTEVGLIGALICAGLTLGLGFWWFKPRPMWQGILLGALAQPVVFSLNNQMVGISNKLGITHLDAALYSPLPEETIKLLGVVIIVAAFKNVRHPYQAAAIGMAIGLGFDAMENVPFILHAAIDNLDGDLWGVIITGIGRFFTGAFSHALYTGVAAWGVGKLYAGARHGYWQVAGFWLAGIALHTLFNASLIITGDWPVTFFLTALITWTLIIWGLRFIRKQDRKYAAQKSETTLPTKDPEYSS
ncbi:PrsW family intramembrane metalloprotease [Corynebacterium marquesiae]|uniref:PrsW family glutamic-type intramembrane protease n=1 Tax=Corynebacterium marquesiae TaxID=2913503 RepID=A0ABU8P817_9CORY